MLILKLLFGLMAFASSDCTNLFEEALVVQGGEFKVSIFQDGAVRFVTPQGQVKQFHLGISIPRTFLNSRFIRMTNAGDLVLVSQTDLTQSRVLPNTLYLINLETGKSETHSVHDLPAIHEDEGIELEGVHTFTAEQQRPLVAYVTSHHKDSTYFRILVADLDSGAVIAVFPVSGGHPLHTRYLGPSDDGLTMYFRRSARGEGLDMLRKTLGMAAEADALIEIELRGGRFVWYQPMH